jgi:hypothetical protein
MKLAQRIANSNQLSFISCQHNLEAPHVLLDRLAHTSDHQILLQALVRLNVGLESDHLFGGPDPEVAYIPAGNVHTGRQEKDIHQPVPAEVK